MRSDARYVMAYAWNCGFVRGRRRIQTPFGAGAGARQSGGGGRPRSSPSGPRFRAARAQEISAARGEILETLQPPVDGRLGRRRLALNGELSERQLRVAKAEPRDLVQSVREALECSRALKRPDGLELRLRGAARADEVGVVGVRKAVRLRPRRGDDRALFEGEHGVARAGERQH